MTGDRAAAARLRFVGFDVLRLDGEDLRCRPWRERDQRLCEALPVSDRVRGIASQPATAAAHTAIVSLGFEGTLLKRPGSIYRPGRRREWVKHKPRCTAQPVLVSVRQDREGHWQALWRREHAEADEAIRLARIPVDAKASASLKPNFFAAVGVRLI